MKPRELSFKMWRLLILLPLLHLAAAAPPRAALDSGVVLGTALGGVDEWVGIPFAAPPIGPRRWRSPAPPVPWTAPRAATSFGAECAQVAASASGVAGAEDCLFVNVWAPSAAAAPRGASLLPVLVWIHGGGFESGSSSLYNGTGIVRLATSLATPIVVVSMNYRLSAFGFLHSPALAARDSGAGNLGLLDQRLALQWVQRNAAAFGGDAARVTVAGESAGGGSISAHLAMPGSAGLFRGAIIESSSFAPAGATTALAAAATFGDFARHSGCAAADSGASAAGDAVTACLLNKTTAELVRAKAQGAACCDFYAVLLPWAPVVTPAVLPVHPFDAVATDRDFLNGTALLHGVNRDEGVFFERAADYAMSAATLLARWRAHYGASSVDALRALYDAPAPPSPAPGLYSPSFEADQTALGDYWALCAARRASRLLSPRGAPPAAVWHYYFQHPPARDGVPFAYHSAEIRFVFQMEGSLDGADELALARAIGAYWIAFAAAGDPNAAAAAVRWPRVGASGNGTALFLDVAARGGIEAVVGHKAAACDGFWDDYLARAMARCAEAWPCAAALRPAPPLPRRS